MSFAAADVPKVIDVLLDGEGYVFARGEDVRARFTHSPTFVERQNANDGYGDNAQDFWMTAKQVDWSLGEQEKYFHPTDVESSKRFWRGSNIDIRTPGQVTLRQKTSSLTFAASVSACAGKSSQTLSENTIFVASSTNLYELDASGTITDRGAHGVGATPSRCGLCTDGKYAYLSEGTAGKVRLWDGSSFSDFSTDLGVDSLCFLNNTLFGFKNSTGRLVRFDGAGGTSTIFTWLRAQGDAQDYRVRLRPYGGKLAILINRGTIGPQLWVYDGTNTYMVAEFPDNFYAHDMEVGFGIIFVGGAFLKSTGASNSNTVARPAVMFYAGGAEDLLWQADAYGSTSFSALETGPYASVCHFDGGVVFNDDTRGVIYYYDASLGGVHTIGSYTVAGNTPLLAGSQRFFLHTRNQATGYYFPDTSAIVSSGTIDSALEDYDSSLDKLFKDVTVEAEIPTGATVDVSYQLNSVDGNYTSLDTGITSGTPVAFPSNTTGRSISIRVTLNKGSSSDGPTLKRVLVRAAPSASNLGVFRQCEYWIDCMGGNLGDTPVQLKNGRDHPKTASEQVADLNTAITSTSPISITDRFGTFTAEIRADRSEIIEVGDESFIAHLIVREV